ncbi:MAG: hypothetical protein AAF939_04435 [Planctomycetota bacterium]
MPEGNFHSFGELANAFGCDESKTNSKQVDEDLVTHLKKLRVDPGVFPILGPHHFVHQIDDQIRKEFESLGDLLYEKRVVHHWTNFPIRIRTRIQLLLKQLVDLPFEFVYPCVFVCHLDSMELPILPPQFAFKGGVARKVLAQALGLNANTSQVRDMDVFYRGENPDPDDVKQVAMSFMQDDWLLAKRPNKIISKQPSLKGYLRTREFTINQLLLEGNQITSSIQSVCDLVAGVIRPTIHHLQSQKGKVEGIVAAKAVRFLVEGKNEGRVMRLDKMAISNHGINKFKIAVHLARALEHGEAVGAHYLEECHQRGLIKFPFDGSVDHAITQLRKNRRVLNLSFPRRD